MSALEPQIDRLHAALRDAHGVAAGEGRTVVSPYRICPIGAHVDHQHGPVLGMAITAYTLLAFAPAGGPGCTLSSGNFPAVVSFEVGEPGDPRASDATRDWGAYARGAAWALHERLPRAPRGVVGRIEGSLPGGGLSSSASVLLAYLLALACVNEIELTPAELVERARRAENGFVGVESGILDPASIVGARRDRLLAIDTERGSWESIELGAAAPDHRILVAFTGTARNLSGTGFNQRVAECREAARRLGELVGAPGAKLLGDLPEDVFDERLEELPAPLRRRARHFASERERVRRGATLWRSGDLAGFGALMRASCESSIASYETGSPELVRLQEILVETPGVLGARFSGGGFGGCSVALVAADAAERVREATERAFVAAFPAQAGRTRFLLVQSEDGVRLA